MPRTSTAELMIKPNVIETPRPDAPYDLTDAEAEEWRAIVASMPPEHFARGNYPLLAQLCRHIVSSSMVAALVASLGKEKQIDTKQLSHLLSLQDRETKTIIWLCKTMRLSQQAVYRGELKRVRPLNGVVSNGNGTMANPWEDEE
jgi:hypothetical protein